MLAVLAFDFESVEHKPDVSITYVVRICGEKLLSYSPSAFEIIIAQRVDVDLDSNVFAVARVFRPA